MKKLIPLALATVLCNMAFSQLKVTPVCPPIVVNILAGNVNEIAPDFSARRVKEKLPCYTSEEPDAASSQCGEVVFYKDKDISFYTGRGYIQIGEKFKGKLSLPLLGAARSSLFKWLGNPKIKDLNWDAFQTEYGTLVLHYNKAGKVNLIQFSKKSTDALSLCD